MNGTPKYRARLVHNVNSHNNYYVVEVSDKEGWEQIGIAAAPGGCHQVVSNHVAVLNTPHINYDESGRVIRDEEV